MGILDTTESQEARLMPNARPLTFPQTNLEHLQCRTPLGGYEPMIPTDTSDVVMQEINNIFGNTPLYANSSSRRRPEA